MSTNFPASIDNLANPTAQSSTSTVSHASQHANANDAIEAIQSYLIQNLPSSTTYVASSEKGVAGGVATLDGSGRLPMLQVPSNFSVDNLTINGQLLFNGQSTQINSTNLTISDPLIYMGENNPSDSVDLGFISSYNDGSYKHTGLVRDASDGVWKLFRGVTDEPGTTVNFNQAFYATLKAGAFIGDGSQLTNLPITPTPSASPEIEGKLVGYTALEGQTNVALGYRALHTSSLGLRSNIAIGTNTMRFSTTGSRNTAVGTDALFNGTAGDNNTVVGSNSLTNATSAGNNTVLGANSLYSLTSGGNNIAIGQSTGNNLTNSAFNNIIIGSGAASSSANSGNEITLGNSDINRFRIPGLGIDWTASTIPSNKVVFNNKTSSYTLQASDKHKMIRINSGTISIPSNVFSAGDEITVQATGTDLIIINGLLGVTIQSSVGVEPVLRTQYSASTIICVDNNIFTIIGDIQ